MRRGSRAAKRGTRVPPTRPLIRFSQVPMQISLKCPHRRGAFHDQPPGHRHGRRVTRRCILPELQPANMAPVGMLQRRARGGHLPLPQRFNRDREPLLTATARTMARTNGSLQAPLLLHNFIQHWSSFSCCSGPTTSLSRRPLLTALLTTFMAPLLIAASTVSGRRRLRRNNRRQGNILSAAPYPGRVDGPGWCEGEPRSGGGEGGGEESEIGASTASADRRRRTRYLNMRDL
jgi:hypothetical protein